MFFDSGRGQGQGQAVAGPGSHGDATGVVEADSETSGGSGPQTGQDGGRIVMDIGGRLSGPSDA
jgi:hypothetical protein